MTTISHEDLHAEIKAARSWGKWFVGLTVPIFVLAVGGFYSQSQSIAVVIAKLTGMEKRQVNFEKSIEVMRRGQIELNALSIERDQKARADHRHDMERHEDRGH